MNNEEFLGTGIVALMTIVFAGPVTVVVWLAWRLIGRPVAVSRGWVTPTAEDFVVRGWEAERAGRWADALAAYDEAARPGPASNEAAVRRANLLRHCPDLAEEAVARLATFSALEVLDYLGVNSTARKLRLVAAACCRRVWHLLTDPRSRRAVEAAEDYADELLPREEAVAIGMAAVEPARDLAPPEGEAALHARVTAVLCIDPQVPPSEVAETAVRLTADAIGRDEQVGLLGCIFGLPHYKKEVAPAWLTPTVVALAKEMYETRDFAAMPILADALQDTGCENEHVLAHCRGDGPHARGCWVIDLVLGKA